MDGYNVAVVGATGAVGEAMVQILEERQFPVKELSFLQASGPQELGCNLKEKIFSHQGSRKI